MKHKQNKATTKNFFFLTPCVLIIVLITVGLGCGKSKEGKNESASDTTETTVSTKQVKLDACEVLGAIGIDEVLGEAIGDVQPQVQMEAEGRAISQCRYQTVSGRKAVTLLLRYSAVDENPKRRAELADSELAADIMGMGEESAAALKRSIEIAGLGDLAFTYDLFGMKNLMVFWNKHYQMTVMVDGFENDAETVDRAKIVAQHVLEELLK